MPIPTGPCALPVVAAVAALLCAPRARRPKSCCRSRPRLEPAVRFWTRVYTEVGRVGRADPRRREPRRRLRGDRAARGRSRTATRERRVEQAKSRHPRRAAHAGAGHAAAGSRATRPRCWRAGPRASATRRCRDAVRNVRFQLGQADRYREGLVRSGAWRDYIEATLREHGVPVELAALPHVESSFNPDAYSRVGAAGLWQFTRSTGRLFLRVDDVLDERLDPQRATDRGGAPAAQEPRPDRRLAARDHVLQPRRRRHAARVAHARHQRHRPHRARVPQPHLRLRVAQLLRLVPRRAARRPELGALLRRARASTRPSTTSASSCRYYYPARSLSRALGVDLEVLREHNPALRPAVWQGCEVRAARLRVEAAESARSPSPRRSCWRSFPNRTGSASSTAIATTACGAATRSRGSHRARA